MLEYARASVNLQFFGDMQASEQKGRRTFRTPYPGTPFGNVFSSAVVTARELAQFLIPIDTANGVPGEAANGKNNGWISFLPNQRPSEMLNENRVARGEPTK